MPHTRTPPREWKETIKATLESGKNKVYEYSVIINAADYIKVNHWNGKIFNRKLSHFALLVK